MIEFFELSKNYGAFRALAPLNLTVPRGEMFAASPPARVSTSDGVIAVMRLFRGARDHAGNHHGEHALAARRLA
jgi:hypothetical protein